jgi:hypothetical protein
VQSRQSTNATHFRNVVDIIAIIATLFGVATSLGLGAEQINAGLNYLYNVPQDVVVQLFIITLITTSATISVISGLNAGIRQLSRVALILGAVLLVLVFILGPTPALLDTILQRWLLPATTALPEHLVGSVPGAGCKLAERLDNCLLGLVDFLGPICGYFYRAHLEGPHDPRVYPGGAACAGDYLHALV